MAQIVSAGSGDGINVYSTNQTDLIVDIAGYFAPGNGVTSKVFNTIYPCRPVNVALFSADVAVPVGGTCGVPADAAGFAINMTAAMNQPVGYFSVWPTGQAWPGVSLMNAIDAISGSKVGNGAIVPAGTSGQLNLRAAGGSATATVDLTGYFSSASSSNVPPVISRQTVVVTSSGATVVWATNEPADTQLFIGGASMSNFSFTMQHVGTLAGLQPSTTYSYEVRSRDIQGAQSVKTGTLRTADAQPTVTSVAQVTRGLGAALRWDPGVSILPDGTLWHTYTTYSAPPQAVAPLEIHAWTIGPGQQFGATRARQNMFPEGWRFVDENRCGTGFCWAAGDFLTISADSQRAIVPFIEGRPYEGNPNLFNQNDLWQMFVKPQTVASSTTSLAKAAGISWSPLGTNFRSRGQAHGQIAPPPASRLKR